MWIGEQTTIYRYELFGAYRQPIHERSAEPTAAWCRACRWDDAVFLRLHFGSVQRLQGLGTIVTDRVFSSLQADAQGLDAPPTGSVQPAFTSPIPPCKHWGFQDVQQVAKAPIDSRR